MNQQLATITWAGDYRAAQQLAEHLITGIKNGEYTVTSGGLLKDNRGNAMYIRTAKPDMSECKYWLGDKVIIRNGHNLGVRNPTRDMLCITDKILRPQLEPYRVEASKREAEEDRKRIDAQKAWVKHEIDSGCTNIVDMAHKFFGERNQGREITPRFAALVLTIKFGWMRGDDDHEINTSAVSEAIGRKFDYEPNTGAIHIGEVLP